MLFANGFAILELMHDIKQIDNIKKWLGIGSINIFGRPLAGKDYQGQQLAKILGGELIGGGEILRSGTMPNHIKECMTTGKLVPSDDYFSIVLPYLNQSRLVGKPLIFSAVGRWHGEEEAVVNAAKLSGHPMKAVIYLDISADDLRARRQASKIIADRGPRPDDTEEILTTRLAEFQEKTMPVIDYYRDHNLLIKVDGRPSRDEVTNSIISALYNHINS